jgi:hypothetical protein
MTRGSLRGGKAAGNVLGHACRHQAAGAGFDDGALLEVGAERLAGGSFDIVAIGRTAEHGKRGKGWRPLSESLRRCGESIHGPVFLRARVGIVAGEHDGLRPGASFHSLP